MSLKFIKTKDLDNKHDQSSVEFTTDHLFLQDVLEDFASFLRACGYTIDGNLEVVKEEQSKEDEYIDEAT